MVDPCASAVGVPPLSDRMPVSFPFGAADTEPDGTIGPPPVPPLPAAQGPFDYSLPN